MSGCPDCGDDWKAYQALYRVSPDGQPAVFKCFVHSQQKHPDALAALLRRGDDNTYEITHHFRVLADSPQAAAQEARRVLREHGFTDPTFFVKARPE